MNALVFVIDNYEYFFTRHVPARIPNVHFNLSYERGRRQEQETISPTNLWWYSDISFARVKLIGTELPQEIEESIEKSVCSTVVKASFVCNSP